MDATFATTTPAFLTGADLLARQIESGDCSALDALQTEPGAGNFPVQALRERVGVDSFKSIATQVRRDAFVWNQILAGKKRNHPPEPEVEYPRRYKIEKRIGAGASGFVHSVTDRIGLKTVAIKMVSDQIPDGEGIKIFERELGILRQLRHPNIVRLFGFGRQFNLVTDGREVTFDDPYLVLELLDEKNLFYHLRSKGPLPWPEAKELLLQVASALAYLHSLGIIYRDLKLENILLAVGEQGRLIVKLIDFGMSLDTKNTNQHSERGFQLYGTSNYVSPEQIFGGVVDGRTDVYSFGALMFYLLTGRPPFMGEEQADVLAQHLNDRPPSPRKVRPDLNIPKQAEAIILKALAKKPADRFQTMAEMAEAIEKCR